MQWYAVKKRIKGNYYWYWQKTYRVGRQVKTLNRYIGPAHSVSPPFGRQPIAGREVELPATTIPIPFPAPVRATVDQTSIDFALKAFVHDMPDDYDFDQAWQIFGGKRNKAIMGKSFPKVDAILSTLDVRMLNSSEQGNFFDPSKDYINIIAKQWWYSASGNSDIYRYYRTVCHELIHWTGHKSRINRIHFSQWGDEGYAMEELTAEMGSIMLLNILGYNENESTEYHAAYFQSWLKRIPDKEQAIKLATGRATKAVRYIIEHGGVL